MISVEIKKAILSIFQVKFKKVENLYQIER